MLINVSPILTAPSLSISVRVNLGEWEVPKDAMTASRLVAHNIHPHVGNTVEVEFRGAQDIREAEIQFNGLIYAWLHDLGFSDNFSISRKGNFTGYWIGD